MADEADQKKEALPEDPKSAGLEGAAEKDAGFLRDVAVEGGEEISIGGSPPSAAGGEPRSPAPTRKDVRE